MNADILLQHFDAISEAQDAVARLRRFVLDLAVRGKLVQQEPTEGTGAELLQLVQAERARLIIQGKARKEKPTAPIGDKELPFDIPSTWSWVRLQQLTSYIQRGKSPKYSTGDGPPVISQKCVQWSGLQMEWAKAITPESLDGYEPIRFLRDGDLLWNSTGTGTIGRVIRVSQPIERLVCDSHVTVVRCTLVDENFIQLWLRSDHVYGSIEDRAAGATNQVELTATMANGQVVPVPPLGEQRRIVARVNELMALCDKLEATRHQRGARSERFVSAVLQSLTDAPEHHGVISAGDQAHLFFKHLPLLARRANHIRQIRRALVSLAVQGRLVPQDAQEGAGGDALDAIRDYKMQLVEAGELRREKPLPALSPDEHPFALPTSWAWARIGDCAIFTEYGTSVQSQVSEMGVPVLKMGDIQDGQVKLGGQKRVPDSIDDLPHLLLKRFDLLYNRTNSAELVGKTGIYLGEDDAYTFASYLIRLRFADHLTDPTYVNFAMNAPYFRETQILPQLTQQCGQANVNGSKLRAMVIPLPPLAEQRRIVAKLTQLLTLCEALEAQLSASEGLRRQCLEVTLADALREGERRFPFESKPLTADRLLTTAAST